MSACSKLMLLNQAFHFETAGRRADRELSAQSRSKVQSVERQIGAKLVALGLKLKLEPRFLGALADQSHIGENCGRRAAAEPEQRKMPRPDTGIGSATRALHASSHAFAARSKRSFPALPTSGL